MSTNSFPRFLTAEQAARCVGITKSTMYDWVNRGYIPHHRLGRLVRIQAADLEAFIQGSRFIGTSEKERQAQRENGIKP
jgi:excisionase family DNA binding protein